MFVAVIVWEVVPLEDDVCLTSCDLFPGSNDQLRVLEEGNIWPINVVPNRDLTITKGEVSISP